MLPWLLWLLWLLCPACPLRPPPAIAWEVVVANAARVRVIAAIVIWRNMALSLFLFGSLFSFDTFPSEEPAELLQPF